MGKNISFWPLDEAKKMFWPATRYELCTPALDISLEIHITILTIFRAEFLYFHVMN